ncbi:hypothetical protein FHX82_002611 [Amycolatopsis bartoniae]|uniref:DUF2332 domain-containing protein n=1 Tax=Amycolatopsis bartoniae TaxID=941986 RepID=A0A8H9IWV8_9PSEU|nr:DUF2332 domain-containing protein [Amycolatopsis bartoniae]MBB2935557.1 hypothetical protein [Amycolatopsis bartoniae]TVT05257.1 DUF2332 domain-containing protein [Amycolatopsis bartoniae]GHF76761.1 hypothetical protein GCM10017566_58640 [Amycolatopsis bartoniae]
MVAEVSTADRYSRFAHFEAKGHSPLYQELASGVAADAEMLALLDDSLPKPKRQPNLLLAAVRLCHGVAADYGQFRGWVLDDPEPVLEIMRTHSTQTNEPARTAAMLPILSRIEGPVALVEVGASAGLCLYPDRFHYDFDGHQVGPESSPVRIRCAVEGPVPLPERLPEVVWRAGIDLNPLDVRNEDDVAWLRALIWPEETERQERLSAAVEIARAEPPLLFTGDLLSTLDSVVARAPEDATVVVFHTAVLNYLSPEGRESFYRKAMDLPVTWISQEAGGAFPEINAKVPEQRSDKALFVLAVSGEPIALTEPHGGWLRWFG